MASLVKRLGGWWAARTSARSPAVLDKELNAVHDTLRATTPSTNVLPEVNDALQRPLEDLQRLETAELRKLAHHAYYGIGTGVDVDKATGLWVFAAMKGCSESTYSVAMCLLEGKGRIEKDEARAVELLEKLVGIKHPWAMFALATVLTRRNNGPHGDQAQLARAIELYKGAADSNVAPACMNVSNFYELGLGTPKSMKKAIQWLQRAAKAGDPSAQIALGRRLAVGDGVERDEERSFALFSLAAESGRPVALFNVGCAYLSGKGVERDPAQAVAWFERAADQGFYPAQMNLANMYAQGVGVDADKVTAMKWFAAASGEEGATPEELVAKAEAALAEGDGEAAFEGVVGESGDGVDYLGSPLSAVDATGKASTGVPQPSDLKE